MNIKNSFIAAALVASGCLCSCTDLDETYYAAVSPDKADVATLCAGAIEQLRGLNTTNGAAYLPSEYVYFVEITSDELTQPARRASDWYDGGAYIELQTHKWTNSNKCILAAWDCYYNVVSNANSTIEMADKYGFNDEVRAQMRMLRAYAYSELLNLFGNIPLYTKSGEMATNTKKADVYRFLIDEINDPAVMDNLPKKAQGQMNQAIAHSVLARLYLNSKVYLELDNESEEYKLNLDSCIMECEAVEGLGFSIENNMYDNFAVDNENSKENILAVPFDGLTTLGNYLQMISHEHSLGDILGVNKELFKDCVNGMCLNPGETEDDENATFNIFDKDRDARFLSIAWGQQYNAGSDEKAWYSTGIRRDENNNIVKDEAGKNVRDTFWTTYEPFFEAGIYGNPGSIMIDRAMRGDGARILKYEFTADQMWEMANDWVLIRLAEIKYMKAESLIRLGKASEAAAVLKEVLSKRGYDKSVLTADAANLDPEGKIRLSVLMDKTGNKLATTDLSSIVPAAPDLEFMDKEWRREFLFEAKRRMTMIRMDKFTGTWGLKKEADPDKHTLLFPIPADAMRKNANLHQNPGYEGYDGWLD